MPCQGIFADVKKSAPENITAENPEIFLERYKSFKKFFETSEGMIIIPYKYWRELNVSAPAVEINLKYVRIYFDTPTFDRITKDRAAKFVDMLSAIGGTMGLLTGFSIISGVEILYHVAKLIFLAVKKKIT